jgi:hypothetical protein
MYQPFPGDQSPQQYAPAGRLALAPPPPVVRAVQLMYAGAAATLIGVVVNLTTEGSATSRLKSQLLKQSPNLTASQLAALDDVVIALSIVGGLIGVGLWIWMALMNKRGRSWARITSTVFFGIEAFGVLVSLVGVGALDDAGPIRFYNILLVLIGLGAIILLWRRQSSDFFNAMDGQRY